MDLYRITLNCICAGIFVTRTPRIWFIGRGYTKLVISFWESGYSALLFNVIMSRQWQKYGMLGLSSVWTITCYQCSCMRQRISYLVANCLLNKTAFQLKADYRQTYICISCFSPVTLNKDSYIDLDPITFTYEPDLDIPKVYPHTNKNSSYRWDTRTWRDVSSYLFTYLPLNYDTPV